MIIMALGFLGMLPQHQGRKASWGVEQVMLLTLIRRGAQLRALAFFPICKRRLGSRPAPLCGIGQCHIAHTRMRR